MSEGRPQDGERVRLTIDGREVEARKGRTILQVCDEQGIAMPRYCYHPGLPISGNCRICMVEVEKMPHTQISCNVPVQDGMVVHTQSEAAREARRHVLEFLLVNHPVDCPVCDQSGECKLQDYYMAHGRYESRLDDDKVHKRKAVVLGPHVILDAERCILCSRCVRFTDEISKTHELGIYNRADRSEIFTAPGSELANDYSACTVDICPVGALLERDFRFQMRVWYLKRKASVCPRCSRGCNIEVHYDTDRPYKAGGRRLLRIKPRYNPDVNKWWMCDIGRFGAAWVDAADRLRRPRITRDGGLHDAGWDSALEETARGLRASAETHGPDAVAALLSPWMTVEEMHLAHRVLTEALGVRHVGSRVPPAEEAAGDDLLITSDRNPNAAGAERLGLESGAGSEGILESLRLGKIRALLVWRHDLTSARDGAALLDALDRLDFLAFAGTNDNPTARKARIVLPLAAWVEREGSFVNVDGRLQTFGSAFGPPGEALPDFDALLRLGHAAGVAYPYERPAEVLASLAAEGGPLHGTDPEAARRLGHAWNVNGLRDQAPTFGASALGREEGVEEG